MKEIVLEQKSWHYWLATFGNKYRVNWHGDDICHYIRSVMVGTFLFLLMVIVGSFLGGVFLFSVANLFSWLFLGYELHKASIGFLSIFGGVFLALGLAVTHEAVKEKMNENEPGFVRAAYRKFKDKTCFYIKFK